MKYLRIGIYILLVFFLFFPFLVLPRLIKVRVVECYNQYGLCSNEFLSKLNPSLGGNINATKKKLTEEFKNTQLIDNYSFRFKFPATLRIDLIFKKAKYALLNKNTNEMFLVDREGVILEKVASTNLPYIIVSGDLSDSKKIFALEIIYGIYYLYQVKSGEIVNDSLEVIIPGEGKIIFPLAGERDILLGSMKLILARAGKFKEIDLRYKNPIIRSD